MITTRTQTHPSKPPRLFIFFLIALFVVAFLIARTIGPKTSTQDGGTIAGLSPRQAHIVTWHTQWRAQFSAMSDDDWDRWLEDLLKGMGETGNWRTLDAKDLYDHSERMRDFFDSLGVSLDDFISTREDFDSLDQPIRDSDLIIQWQDTMVGLLTEELLKEGLDIDTPIFITDFLDKLLGNVTDGEGTVLDNEPKALSLEELYKELLKVIIPLRQAQNEGDEWVLNHPETVKMFEQLFEHVKRMLIDRGITPPE